MSEPTDELTDEKTETIKKIVRMVTWECVVTHLITIAVFCLGWLAASLFMSK